MSDSSDTPDAGTKPLNIASSHNESQPGMDYLTAGFSSPTRGGLQTPSYDGGLETPGGLSRTGSYSNLSDYADESESFPPLDRLTFFDVLENLALPQHFERIQDRVRKQQKKLQQSSKLAKDKVIDQWRRRVPTPDEQLDKYRKRMRENVDRFNKRWSDAQAVTAREKVSFIGGVLNILISGYMIGACPEYFHYWYTVQLLYFMPVRWYTYHKIGFHYFLADLCYFVNFLMVLCIWFFPNSKRLFISTFCLAFGNNAVAIAMWRNSLVFHSLDKVTSLFIHIMPCVTLHCIVHLLPEALLLEKFPAIHTIKTSSPSSPEHYSLRSMVIWATVPYFAWQISYHLLITVRRREKIAAGRPTSFTWLRRSYAKNPLGRLVLSLPEVLQEPAFMAIQYSYALLTMIPCPLWFWYRWASATFLLSVFTWATYNGATYYIDVFGRRMEKELEALRREVRAWQASPEHGPRKGDARSPLVDALRNEEKAKDGFSLDGTAQTKDGHTKQSSLDKIPPLDERPKEDGLSAVASTTSVGVDGGLRKR